MILCDEIQLGALGNRCICKDDQKILCNKGPRSLVVTIQRASSEILQPLLSKSMFLSIYRQVTSRALAYGFMPTTAKGSFEVLNIPNYGEVLRRKVAMLSPVTIKWILLTS
jgi:hypothetical protein